MASSAAVIWSLACYLRSDHLRRRTWSAGLGLALALTALSRSVSPVYVAPMVLLILADVVHDRWRRRSWALQPVLLAAVTGAAIAGPWWVVSGPTALAYLLGAGYSSNSDLSGGGLSLGLGAIQRRVWWTVSDLGGVQTVALLAALASALVLVVVGRSRLHGIWTLPAWSVFTLLLLSTSGNVGTGFGLPVLVVVIVTVASVLASAAPTRHFPLARTGAATALLGIAGVAALFLGGESFWWQAAPYRVMVLQAGGSAATDVEVNHQNVAALTRGEVVLMTRDDALLNTPGLSWHGARLVNLPFGPEATAASIDYLHDVSWLISGTSPALYHPSLKQRAVERAAAGQGFTLVRTIDLGQRNEVRLWHRRSSR